MDNKISSKKQQQNCRLINFAPFPVLYPNCFSQLTNDDSSSHAVGGVVKQMVLRSKLIYNVPPDENEKRVIIERRPLIIEFLKNNWSWHDKDREEPSSEQEKNPKRCAALVTRTRISNTAGQQNGGRRGMGNTGDEQAAGDDAEIQVENNSSTEAGNNRESTDTEHPADSASAIQPGNVSSQSADVHEEQNRDELHRSLHRNILSMAAQAMMEMEEGEQEEEGGVAGRRMDRRRQRQQQDGGVPIRHPVRVRRPSNDHHLGRSGDQERNNTGTAEEDAIETPPPAKQNRTE